MQKNGSVLKLHAFNVNLYFTNGTFRQLHFQLFLLFLMAYSDSVFNRTRTAGTGTGINGSLYITLQLKLHQDRDQELNKFSTLPGELTGEFMVCCTLILV